MKLAPRFSTVMAAEGDYDFENENNFDAYNARNGKVYNAQGALVNTPE